jgi:hypothetical protein
VSEMRGGVTVNTDPKSITPQQAVRLHQLLHEVGGTMQDIRMQSLRT